MGCGSSVAGGAIPASNGVDLGSAFAGLLGTSVGPDGKAMRIPDLTICHSHDPYLATVQSWFRTAAGKGNAALDQVQFDKAAKEFFQGIKQWNKDTQYSAKNSLESHVNTLKAKWESFKTKNAEASTNANVAATYAQLVIYAGISKLLGTDDHTDISKQMIKFSEADPEWATTVLERLQHPGAIVYRPHKAIGDYVYPLPSKSGSQIKIALISDWGTGTPQAYDMLKKIANFKPDLAIHLGDVYYSGTYEEEHDYVYKPVKECLPGVPFYNLAGNHDYYSGGEGFLQVLDEFRTEGVSKQQSSYFCLEGDSWIILAMDTSLHDADPLGTVSGAAVPWIEDSEAEWHRDKISKAKAAGKKVIMMSHHQWCTLCSTVGKVDGVDQALNHHLHRQLGDSVKDLDVWFWGHEHSLQLFHPYAGLKRGRLIGNGSVPTLVAKKVYEPKTGLAPATSQGESALPQAHPLQMSVADFGYYYNNSFVILTLEGAKATAEYYDIPWHYADLELGNKWGQPKLVYSEEY